MDPADDLLVVEDVLPSASEQTGYPPMTESTAALLQAFSTHLLAAGRGTGTVHLRLVHLKQLAEEHPDLLAVTFHELESYFAVRRMTHKAETRKSLRSSFRAFYAWAYAEELIERDPSARLAPIRVPSTEPRMAPDKAIEAALALANSTERAIILLGRLGCLRRAEIAGLHMKDRDRDVLHVTGKGEKRRAVYCHGPLVDALTQLEQHQEFGYYFPGRTGGHMQADTVHHVISTLTGWNPHSLRHAGATDVYQTSKDIEALQKLLGHSSIVTTQRYIHSGEDEMRAAVAGMRFGGAA
jgi:integrase/recombinase XerC